MRQAFIIAAAALLSGQAACASPVVSSGGGREVSAEAAQAARDLLQARRANAARQRAGDPGAVWMAFGRPTSSDAEVPAK